jgi:hypothetical protein
MNLPVRPAAASRREFFRGTARWGLVSLLIGIATRNLRRMSGREVNFGCINDGWCADCTAFARCQLPDAFSARRKLTGG